MYVYCKTSVSYVHVCSLLITENHPTCTINSYILKFSNTVNLSSYVFTHKIFNLDNYLLLYYFKMLVNIPVISVSVSSYVNYLHLNSM